MTVVQNTATDPAGNPLAQIGIHINLMTGSPTMPGYTGSGDIIGTADVTTDTSGHWSATLTPNASITPANTYYQVVEGQAISNIVVPASGGPYLLASLLVTPPPTPAAVGITGVQVAAAGTVAGVRPEINLIGAGSVNVAAADNPTANRVDVTVSGATALPPNGTAGGDLSGSYPSPTVAKVNGVSVPGTPAAGQMLTALTAGTAAWQPAPIDWLNAKNSAYGALGDGIRLTDGAMTAASNVFTSASASFTAADVGKLIVVLGAGALNGSIGTPLPGTITGYTSATQVTLSATAATTVAGATATYGSDDHTALQAMINACQPGRTGFLPYGIYMSSAELSITQVMRLTSNGATICTTNSAAVNFGNVYITAASGSSTTTGLEIDHLVFDVSGGHVFYGTNFNKFSWHDLRLVQRSYNFAAWYSTAQNLLDADIRNVVTRVYGNPRTVQAWYLKSALGGGIAMFKAQNCLFQNGDLDASQYFVWIECEDASNHSYTNDLTFEHAWFDSAYGGCVKLLATQGASFRNCNIIDSYSATWGNSAYYIGAATSNGLWASQKVSFLDCGRDLSGPNGTTSWDIECESTTDSVTIQSYAIRDTVQPPTNTKPQFNFHGCTNVLLLNDKYRLITNAASTSVELLDGNISFTGALGGASQPPAPQPGDAGYQSWPYLPELITSSGSVTLGQVLLVAQYIRSSVTLTGVVLYIGTALTTGTTGQNFVALYNSAGTLLAVSADVTATFGSTGGKKVPFTSPIAVTAGTYWAAVLNNGATAMQLATRAPNPAGILNIGTGATTYRFGYAGGLTAQTSMPGSFTPGSNTQAGGAYWVGTY